MMPVAFVAGATGYTGREVVAELRRRQIATVAHVRPDSSRRDEFTANFAALGAAVDTTAWNLPDITRAMQEHRPTLLFALLGTTRSNAKREQKRTGQVVDYEKVDYGLTQMLVTASSRSSLRPRFVYLSSLGVSQSAPGAYMQARWKAEQAVIHSNLPYTIVRPSFITGDDRDENRVMERVSAVAADVVLDALAVLGGRTTHDRFASMTGRQLAAAIVSLALDPLQQNQIVEGEHIPRNIQP